MTIAFTFTNDANGQPAVYNDRPDLDAFTLTVTSDSATPVALPSLRLGFPMRIFTVAQVAKVAPISAEWHVTAAGAFITLTPAKPLSLVKGTPLVVKLTGVCSTNPAATTDVVQLFASSDAPTAKLFLMRYPSGAGDLTTTLSVAFDPATVYRTPSDFATIGNVLTLRLSNLLHAAPLVTLPWVSTPTVSLSFVYGADIGSLTPADAPIKDPHSAYNIQVDVKATYKDGTRTFEWRAVQPSAAAESTDTVAPAPVWTLQPVAENRAVLGPAGGASAEFRISGLSTAAPAGATLAYLQCTNFPGYSDCFFTIALAKKEPQPTIVYFDGVPEYVEEPGASVTLDWQTSQMARVTLQADGQALPGHFDADHGSFAKAITRTTHFALLAFTNAGDPTPAHSAQWTAHVPDAQVLSFAADHHTVAAGEALVVSWTSRHALSGTIDGGGVQYSIPKELLDAGSKTYYPRVPTTYALQLIGQGDPPARTFTVFVLPPGWFRRSMGFAPNASQGPVLFANSSGLTLVGGNSENAIFQSADGITWKQTGTASFPARTNAAGCTLGNTLWITGGLCASVASNDVWSSTDGVNWTQATAAAQWPRRSAHACVAFANKLWVIGGRDQNLQPLGDVWSSSDGITWTQVARTGTGWNARANPAVTAFNNMLWLFGGQAADGSVSADLWNSADGASWSRADGGVTFGSGPGARQGATLASADGASLYLFGGIDQSGVALNDFNLFDSGDWDLADGPGAWTVRQAGSALWQGALWFAGGLAGSAASDQVWSWYQPPAS